MIILGVSGLSVGFGGQTVLSDVTFSVAEGERVGVIGSNGVGKTTLLRAVCGELTPDAGSVSIAKDRTVGLLEQVASLKAAQDVTLSVYVEAAFPHLLEAERELERVEREMADAAAGGDHARASALSATYDRLSVRFAEAGGQTFRARAAAMLGHLGFDEAARGRPLSALSGGQHTRVALARLLAQQPDLLLLDEPTNHLDTDALAWLEEHLAAYRGTVIVVSHDRYFLDRVTNRTLHISFGRADLYPGNYTEAKERREADDASRERRRREQQKIRDRILANIEFQRRCGQEHNFVTIRSKQKQLDRMEVIEKSRTERTVRMRFETAEESAANVLTVRGLSFAYPGGAPLLRGVSFAVRRGERVLLLGRNGVGKSTLMRLLCGRLPPDGGYIELGYRVSVGYYDQQVSGLDPARTVWEEMRSSFPDRTDRELRSALALFLFGADGITRTIGSLSGGERARLLLCKLMQKKVNLLLLDEPTNHLDIASREALEAALGDYDGTVVAVSHDRYFIDRVASRVIEIDPAAPDGVIDCPLEEEEGAWEVYTRLRAAAGQTETAASAPAEESDAKRRYEEQKRERAQRSSAARREETARRRADELEAEIDRLNRGLADPARASDYVYLADLTRRREAAEEELLALYEELL